MKRLHVHVSVPELDSATRFYTQLFGADPAVQKDDYAKWRLDDPFVNFAISARGAPAGLDHLGIEVDSTEELSEVTQRMDAAGQVFDQGAATCCYSESEKAWVRDPQGVAWEAFHTTGEATSYGHEAESTQARIAGDTTRPTAPGGGLGLPTIQPEQSCCSPSEAQSGDCEG